MASDLHGAALLPGDQVLLRGTVARVQGVGFRLVLVDVEVHHDHALQTLAVDERSLERMPPQVVRVEPANQTTLEV